MRCFRGGLTLGVHKIPFRVFSSMPVILPERHHAVWLGETDDGNLKELLLPYPADQMRMWEISPRVNSPKNDDPSLTKANPVAENLLFVRTRRRIRKPV